MLEFFVVVYLTFMDGSVVAYNDAKWDVVSSQKECKEKIDIAVKELREAYKDAGKSGKEDDPAPSTFMLGCVQQEKTE